MSAEQVSNMTIDELKHLINETIDRRMGMVKHGDKRSLAEVLDSIDRHRFTPPPGSRSTGKLLREDRDS